MSEADIRIHGTNALAKETRDQIIERLGIALDRVRELEEEKGTVEALLNGLHALATGE